MTSDRLTIIDFPLGSPRYSRTTKHTAFCGPLYNENMDGCQHSYYQTRPHGGIDGSARKPSSGGHAVARWPLGMQAKKGIFNRHLSPFRQIMSRRQASLHSLSSSCTEEMLDRALIVDEEMRPV